MTGNYQWEQTRAAMLAELGRSPLIVHELTDLNEELVANSSAENKIYFGTGLVANKQLTQGLPLDFLGYLLTAERARRACKLAGIVHVIADNHAKHEVPERAAEIADISEELRAACKRLSVRLGLESHYTVLLASDLHATEAFQTLHAGTSCVEDLGIPRQAINYLRTQLADMEYARQHLNVLLKLSWVLDRKILRGGGGFDERFFDNAYAKVFGNNLSYVYTSSGRTFDSSKPRSSPYVATDKSVRLMLWPEENAALKLSHFEQSPGRTTKALFEHLQLLVTEFEAIVEVLQVDHFSGKIITLSQMGRTDYPRQNGSHALLSTLAEDYQAVTTTKNNSREGNITTSQSTIEELHRGIAILTPPEGLRKKLEEAGSSQRPLLIKLGMDPTAPDLHLGHAVVLRKMRQFQDAGHKLVVIIGDFTARIGDPTGRNKARPPLSQEVIQQNSRTYLDQLSKVLDMDPSKLDLRFNSEWLGKMNFADVVRLLSKATLAQLLQREDFNNRYTHGIPISMHELLYPLMQGCDSLVLGSDIEMGGTDQLFNCLIGRSLQESDNKTGQIVVSMPLLIGLDGKEKMSKSYNNYIGLTEEPNQMFGKAMSMPDHLLENYLDLVTDFSAQEVAEIKDGLKSGARHPMEVKKAIAANIVKQYHGETASTDAATYFYHQFQEKEDAAKTYVPVETEPMFSGAAEITFLALCAKLQPEVSKSQLRRLITAGAVSVDDNKIMDPFQTIRHPDGDSLRIRIGKRGFFVLVPSGK